jgi:hypothetical protein
VELPLTNLLQLQRRPRPSSQNSTRNELREFFMTPQGEISWQYKHIWFHSYNAYIFCRSNCLLHHCDSIHRMYFLIKCWFSSSCILYVCSFPINTHFSLRTVLFVLLTYQIWIDPLGDMEGTINVNALKYSHVLVCVFHPTATLPFCHLLLFLRHLHRP